MTARPFNWKEAAQLIGGITLVAVIQAGPLLPYRPDFIGNWILAILGVLRHGATHNDQADTDPFNLDNIAKQRQRNDKGRADARGLGDVFRRAGVPLGRVYSSRFQRAVETARLIAGREPEATADITEGGLVVSPNENSRRAQALRALVAAAPDAGANTLIVTYRPNIMDALGRDWFDIREGEAAVVWPDGAGGYAVVGRVQIGQWASAK